MSEGFEVLSTTATVQPGARFFNLSTRGFCSVGWLVRPVDRQDQRLLMVTAGHCGRTGDRISIGGANSQDFHAGVFVDSIFNDDIDDHSSPDIGLVELARGISYNSAVLDGISTATESMGSNGLEAGETTVCRVGYRTGMSCGPYIETDQHRVLYYGISDQGNSGGPVFVYYANNRIVPVGVVSAGRPTDATVMIGQYIQAYMDSRGVELI